MGRIEKNKELHEEIKNEELDKKRKKRRKRLIIFGSTFIILIISLFSYMYFVGTTGLFVREYKVVSSKLPDEFHGFKIVQFSDLHYGGTIDKSDVLEIVKKINLLKPDILVFTGDLMDEEYSPTSSDITFLTEQFNKIIVTTSKYAVKGNHDYINDNFVNIFTNSNFNILNNDYDLIYSNGYTPIMITGIGSGLKGDVDINKAFSYTTTALADPNIFTVSILHEPDLLDNELKDYKVDLALAGHSHNGQIRLPFIGDIFKINGAKKYSDMFYNVDDTKLFISGGLGTSIYKFRLFDRPSITLIRLAKH